MLRRVVETLSCHSYRFVNELELHDRIAQVLTSASIPFDREFVAGQRDRFDFLIAPDIVIEVKVDGSLAEALGQVNRYAAREDVGSVVLATSRHWGRDRSIGDELHGKPFRLLHLRRVAF